MSGTMPNIDTMETVAIREINDDSFEIAQELLDFRSKDDSTNINKWIEKAAQIRHRLADRCNQLADSLDEMVVKHAAEMELCKQENEHQLAQKEGHIDQLLDSLNYLNNKNQAKTDLCQQFKDLLQSIHEQIQEFFGQMQVDQQESENDGNEVVDDSVNNNAGAENQHVIEPPQIGKATDVNATAATEQTVAGHGPGQNAVEQMVIDGEENAGEPGENVQPQDAASSSTVPLQPAPIVQVASIASAGQQTLDTPTNNNNQVIKCFRCVETFVQETAYIDHLVHFHEIVVNEHKPNAKTKPGQYVLNPKKRKHIKITDENGNDDEIDADPRSCEEFKRKAKKPFSPAN